MSAPTRALAPGFAPAAAPQRAVAPRARRATAASTPASAAAPPAAARCARVASAAAPAPLQLQRRRSSGSRRAARLVAASVPPAAAGEQWWTAHADVFAEVADSEALGALLTAAPANQARARALRRDGNAARKGHTHALCASLREARACLPSARAEALTRRLAPRRGRSWWCWSGCRRPARYVLARARVRSRPPRRHDANHRYNRRLVTHPLPPFFLPPSRAQHCAAALESTASAAATLRAAGAPATFARVTCSTPAAKALAKAADVKALPMLTLYRAHTKLLEFTPSARGTPAAAAARLATLLSTVAAEQRTNVHFTMMAGDVHVVDGPPAAPQPKFDYAAMRAKAVAEAAAAKAAAAAQEGGEEEGVEGECDAGEDAEECGVKW
jgi:hypothetical protein